MAKKKAESLSKDPLLHMPPPTAFQSIVTAEYKTPTKPSVIDVLKLLAIPIHYARFHSPVPPCQRLEPVSEFRVKTDKVIPLLAGKYYVDSLLWIPGKCLLWSYKDEEYAVESANIMYTRISP